MKAFIMCDLEGTAGVVDFHLQTYADAPYLEDSRRFATLELNALVDGCVEAGATDVVVVDGHGCGGLTYELMHAEARLVMGRPIRPPYGLDRSFDAVLLYGHHAMNATPGGVLCHSWSSRTIEECWLNNEPIGEIGLECALAGYYEVPAVFVSGDAAACAEARRYVPEIEAVVTKEGLSRTSAVCLAPERSRLLHREAGRRACERRSQVSRYAVQPPYEFRTRYVSDAVTNTATGGELVDERTTVVHNDDLLEIARLR